MYKTQKNIITIAVTLSVLLLSGCSTSDDDSTTTPTTTTDTYTPQSEPTNNDTNAPYGKGIYVDATVEGIHYQCGVFNGYTDNNGEFIYEIDKPCTFKVGALEIRKIDANKLHNSSITIQENDTKVAQLLLAIDKDADENHIQIDSNINKVFKEDYYRTSIKNIDLKKLISHTIDRLSEEGIDTDIILPEQDEAKEHIKNSYQSICHKNDLILTDNSKKDIVGQCNNTNQTNTNNQTSNTNTNNTQDSSNNDNYTNTNNQTSNTNTNNTNKQNNNNNNNTNNQTSNTSNTTNDTKNNTSQTNNTTTSSYDYIPKGSELTDAMAVKFLNMTTFGATPKLVKELKSKGVLNWVDEMLNTPYNPKKDSLLRKVIERCITIDAVSFDRKHTDLTVDDWLEDDNGYYFNRNKINGIKELDHHMTLIFDQHLRAKNQLRERVAYALSQIVIASESNDNFFKDRGEALSYYYDILNKHAFDNYADLLYDVSMSSTMATFLTYANNPKAYQDPDSGTTILPDENYGREIMQLFTIGLYKLNMDGTEVRKDGKRVPTYKQEDVNNMSRIFTGLQYRHANWGDSIYKADTTHPLICNMQYHDTEDKKILGTTISGGASCEDDIHSAINMLMNHPNVAPFISKKLILRLTKSNPKTDYVQRVASVFASTNGNLKETIKAILLDPEIWEDIKNNRGTKIKEPYLSATQVIRALDYKPTPWHEWVIPSTGRQQNQRIYNPGFITDGLYKYVGQYPTQSPSVFNFYDDAFEPDDSEFKIRGFVAPELEIITPMYDVAYNNFMSGLLYDTSISKIKDVKGEDVTPDTNAPYYRAFRTYMYVDYADALDIARNNHFADKLDNTQRAEARKQIATEIVDLFSQKLLGKILDDNTRNKIIDNYKNGFWPSSTKTDARKMREFIQFWVRPIILEIIHTDEYMVN